MEKLKELTARRIREKELETESSVRGLSSIETRARNDDRTRNMIKRSLSNQFSLEEPTVDEELVPVRLSEISQVDPISGNNAMMPPIARAEAALPRKPQFMDVNSALLLEVQPQDSSVGPDLVAERWLPNLARMPGSNEPHASSLSNEEHVFSLEKERTLWQKLDFLMDDPDSDYEELDELNSPTPVYAQLPADRDVRQDLLMPFIIPLRRSTSSEAAFASAMGYKL